MPEVTVEMVWGQWSRFKVKSQVPTFTVTVLSATFRALPWLQYMV